MTPVGQLRHQTSALAATARLAGSELAQAAGEVRRGHAGQRAHEPAPPATGLVIDIGAGQTPHPRAAVVVDKYLTDSFERPGEEALDLSKPVVIADGHHLPFADGGFAYAIASHVLEHATDPTRFAAELARVASAGFVQVPTRASELTFGWAFHPWLIDRDGDELVFEARAGQSAPCGPLFHDSYRDSALFRLWWAATRDSWHHSIEWSGSPRVRVAGEGIAEQVASFDTERTVAALHAAERAGRLRPLTDDVRAILCCPSCRGALRLDRAAAACERCACSYPVAGGVPVLLAEAAAPA